MIYKKKIVEWVSIFFVGAFSGGSVLLLSAMVINSICYELMTIDPIEISKSDRQIGLAEFYGFKYQQGDFFKNRGLFARKPPNPDQNNDRFNSFYNYKTEKFEIIVGDVPGDRMDEFIPQDEIIQDLYAGHVGEGKTPREACVEIFKYIGGG